MKRLTLCLGLLLGLGAVGCTEHNPAYHQATTPDAEAPAQDTAVDQRNNPDRTPPDARGNGKDGERRSDTPISPREAGLDIGPRPSDGKEPDGRADLGEPDGKHSPDTSFEATPPDGTVNPPPDANPVSLDTQKPESPILPPDAADALLHVDGPEIDTLPSVLPDAEEADASSALLEPQTMSATGVTNSSTML